MDIDIVLGYPNVYSLIITAVLLLKTEKVIFFLCHSEGASKPICPGVLNNCTVGISLLTGLSQLNQMHSAKLVDTTIKALSKVPEKK